MFHIHCGYEKPDIDTSLILIRYFDAYIGLPSVLLDSDSNRRKLYGKSGCFRLCDYGFEYRVLSSEFLRNKTLLTFVWEGICRALVAFIQDMNLPNPDQVQEAINNSNVELAKKIIKKYNIDFDISNLDQEVLFEDGYVSFGEKKVRRAKKEINEFDIADADNRVKEFLGRVRNDGIVFNGGILDHLDQINGLNNDDQPVLVDDDKIDVAEGDKDNDFNIAPWELA